MYAYGEEQQEDSKEISSEKQEHEEAECSSPTDSEGYSLEVAQMRADWDAFVSASWKRGDDTPLARSVEFGVYEKFVIQPPLPQHKYDEIMITDEQPPHFSVIRCEETWTIFHAEEVD